VVYLERDFDWTNNIGSNLKKSSMTSIVKIQTIGGVLSEKTELLHQLVNGEIPQTGTKHENFKSSTKTVKYPEQQYEVTFLEPIRNYLNILKTRLL
jgi:hypothetical protein